MERNVKLVNVISRMCEKYHWQFLEVGTKDFTKFMMFSDPHTTRGDRTMCDITIMKSGFVSVSDKDREEVMLKAYHEAWNDEYAITPEGPVALTGCFCSNPECEMKFNCPTLSCGVKRASYVDREGAVVWSKCAKCDY